MSVVSKLHLDFSKSLLKQTANSKLSSSHARHRQNCRLENAEHKVHTLERGIRELKTKCIHSSKYLFVLIKMQILLGCSKQIFLMSFG